MLVPCRAGRSCCSSSCSRRSSRSCSATGATTTRSDHASFERAGIPVGGVFTGLDDCYHQRCDTLRNVDRDVLAQSARAVEATLVDLSR